MASWRRVTWRAPRWEMLLLSLSWNLLKGAGRELLEMLVFRPPLMMTRKKRVVRRMSMTLLPDTLVTRDLSTLAMLRRVPPPWFLLELYLALALALARKGVHSIPKWE